MKTLRVTLLSEGSSDRALLPILLWLIQEHAEVMVQQTWADLRQLPTRPRGLTEKIARAIVYYPCDVLFVHRDADRESRSKRVREIHDALAEALPTETRPPAVCVVPVRMLEAWFLFDEEAIREASGNPSGTRPLDLPALRTLEKLPDPKARLATCIRAAADQTRRRRRKVRPSQALHRVAELTTDFTPLRSLDAFRALEEELVEVFEREEWI